MVARMLYKIINYDLGFNMVFMSCNADEPALDV